MKNENENSYVSQAIEAFENRKLCWMHVDEFWGDVRSREIDAEDAHDMGEEKELSFAEFMAMKGEDHAHDALARAWLANPRKKATVHRVTHREATMSCERAAAKAGHKGATAKQVAYLADLMVATNTDPGHLDIALSSTNARLTGERASMHIASLAKDAA